MRHERSIDAALEAKLERLHRVMREQWKKLAEEDPVRLVLAMLEVVRRHAERQDRS